MEEFISCGLNEIQTQVFNQVTFYFCTDSISDVEILTTEEVRQRFGGYITTEQAWIYSTYIYAGGLLAWGFKAISHKLRFGR